MRLPTVRAVARGSLVFASGVALAAGLAGCMRASPATPRVVDLGHPLTASDPSWSGAPDFSRTIVATFEKDTYASGRFETGEHFGTHVDAPAHFDADGWTVDAIPPDRLVRPGVRIDIQDKVRDAEDYRMTLDDVLAFEKAHGAIEEGAIVLVATGWDRRWGTDGRYMNVRDGVKRFPGISVEAVRLLAGDRGVAGIGIDTPSIDHGPSQQFEAHRTSQPLNVYHIENAANLTSLPARGFTIVVAPVRIGGGSGAPARVFALVK